MQLALVMRSLKGAGADLKLWWLSISMRASEEETRVDGESECKGDYSN